jgi:hypothetical protein
MDINLVKQINELTLNAIKNNSSTNNIIVQSRLVELEYQINLIKFKLKIIDDPSTKLIETENSDYALMFSHQNAFSAQHLVIPLLMYLFNNHRKRKPAYETSVEFMRSSKDFLRPGDFHKTKTGSIRFITNARFAAEELRKYGLIRSDYKTYYKIWELSVFGIIVAGMIYRDEFKQIVNDALKQNNQITAKEFNRDVVNFYISKAENIEGMKDLFDYVTEEQELILESVKLSEKRFKEFQQLIKDLYKENSFANSRLKVLFDFVHSSNEDKELSKLADLIILRKNIEVNLRVVYDILNNATLTK